MNGALLFFSILACVLTGVFVLLFSKRIAGRLTKIIISSINNVDLVSGNGTYDELSPFISHINDQKKRLNEQLEEILKERALLDALSKNMNEGLILVDRNDKVQSINQSACKILKVDVNCVGKSILETIRRADILERLKLAIAGQNNEFIFDLASRTYQALFSPVDNGALILLLDISEKAAAEKLRQEFSANVSHELKTPLTIISGYAELIQNGMVKNEDIKGIAVKINNESARLITLINDIIRLSQLDEGVGLKYFSEFNLCEVVREAAENLKSRADDAEVTIKFDNCRMYVSANRDMMYELFYNLIDNSVKYNKPGGSVSINISRQNDKIAISVADTGIGIEAKHLSRIFERFYRVDPSRSKKTGGTGLGLSIVKHIAAFHNGTVSIESKPGDGTTIHILF